MINKETYEAIERIDKLSIELATAFIKSQNIIIAELQNDIECQKAEIEKLKSENLVLSQKRLTIDVKEIVKCKGRKYFQTAKVNNKGFLICPTSGMEITETDYCSYGERKEVDDDKQKT